MCDSSDCVMEYVQKKRDSATLGRAPNPLREGSSCGLLNSKKPSYYTNTYHPPTGLPIKSLNGVDLTSRSNCCLCVSFSLYMTGHLNFRLYTYVATIIRSVENIKKYLPNWLVRLYIDPSVFNSLILAEKSETVYQSNDRIGWSSITDQPKTLDEYATLLKMVKSGLDSLYRAENVEIYTYFCDTDDPLGYQRTYRLLSLIDPEVAAYAIRDADGVVTAVECNNLDCMVLNRQPMYVTLSNSTCPGLVNNRSYAVWLNIYKKLDPYFNDHANLIDLMAGMIAGTVKFQPSHYYACMQSAISFVQDTNLYRPRIPPGSQLSTFYFALDEIFLLKLYRDLVCIKTGEDIYDRLEVLLNGTIANDSSKVTYIDSIFIVVSTHKTGHLKKVKVSSGDCIPEILAEGNYYHDSPWSYFSCTMEELKRLHDSELDRLTDLDPKTRMLLLFQLIDRLILPSNKYLFLFYLYHENIEMLTSPSVANMTHITSFSNNEAIINSMVRIRARTKALSGDLHRRVRDVKMKVPGAVDKITEKIRPYLGFRFNCPEIIKTYLDMDPHLFADIAATEMWQPREDDETDRLLVEKVLQVDHPRAMALLDNAAKCNNEFLARVCISRSDVYRTLRIPPNDLPRYYWSPMIRSLLATRIFPESKEKPKPREKPKKKKNKPRRK